MTKTMEAPPGRFIFVNRRGVANHRVFTQYAQGNDWGRDHLAAHMNQELAGELDECLSAYPPEIARMAKELLACVQRAFPELDTRFVPDWRGIVFHHQAANAVACLLLGPRRVNLLFVHGRELDDREGRLVGKGRQSALMHIPPDADIPENAILDYFGAAIALRS